MSNPTATLTRQQAYVPVQFTALKNIVPSVFTETAAQRTSDQYTHIMTSQVVEDLNELGWQVNRATEIRAKKEENKGFQKHILHFRNENIYIGNDADSIEMLPELILTNSHDGRSSFKFYSGLYRVVCSNGLIVSTYKMNSIEIPHRGYSFKELQDVVKTMIQNIPLMIQNIEKLMARKVTKAEKTSIAMDVMRARWDHRYSAPATQILEPLREEDKGDNLWLLYNLLQEKLIKGGWVGAGGRKIKQITDQNRELNINRKLFEIINSYV